MSSPDVKMHYEPGGPTILKFHKSQAFVRGIMGPIGSSKSTACAMEILRRAKMQRPSPDGIRRTRWAIVRNSYPELKTTTIKTWTQWVPAQYGKLTYDSPITHHIKSGDLDMEVFFIALDKPDDVKKVLSLELTGVWFNEAREVSKAIVDAMTGRVGRYPNKMLSPPVPEENFEGGCSWYGIMLDTNPCDDQHWWYQLAEGETPEGWDFFKQPSGTSPEAENLKNLPSSYYKRLMAGKDEDWIKVYVHGEYGVVTEGKPVFPSYRDSVHCAPEEFEPLPDLPILIGMDFGLTPAAILGQKLYDGRWLIFDEFVTGVGKSNGANQVEESCGLTRFKYLLRTYIATKYPSHNIEGVEIAWGDPAGNAKDQDENTAYDIINADKEDSWDTKPAPTNDLSARREVVINCLGRMIDGKPGILISPRCQYIRKGFAGGYHFAMVRTGGDEMYHEAPRKNKFSHPHDGLQYLLLGGGEYAVTTNRDRKRAKRPRGVRIAQDVDYDIFG